MNYYDYIPFGGQAMPAAAIPRTMPTMTEGMQTDTIFMYPQNLAGALTLITEAVSGETEDRMFYTWLIENAPTEEEKQIISGIRDNEIKHFNMFRQIYMDITGKPIPAMRGETFTPPASYCEGLKKALLGEQNAVQKYRKIFYAMQSRVHMNMMIEIITDEIRHGSLYNYLFAKNGCNA